MGLLDPPAYHKPTTGIPRTDLATTVTGSLTLGDSSAQPTDSHTFYVSKYRAGATDDLDAVKQAYAAALAAAATHPVTVDLGGFRNFTRTTGTDHSLEIGAGNANWITVRNGRVKLGGIVTCMATASISAGTYQKHAFEDIIIDVNGTSPFSYQIGGPVFTYSSVTNVSDFRFSRIRTISNRAIMLGGIESRGIQFTMDASTNHGDRGGTFTDILIEDCQLGGNYGVLIQGFPEHAFSAAEMEAATGTTASVPLYLDRIHIRNCVYDAGTPPDPTVTGYSSTGFMVGGGGSGGRLLIENCRAANSSDDLIEVNSMRDVIIRNCEIQDGHYEGIYLTNLGGVPEPDEQRVLIENCKFINTVTQAHPILCGSKNPFGHLTIKDCHFVSYVGPMPAITVTANFKSVTIENITRVIAAGSDVATSNNQTFQASAIVVTPRGGRGPVSIKNIKTIHKATYDRATFSNFTGRPAVAQVEVLDGSVTIDNITSIMLSKKAQSGTTIEHRMVSRTTPGAIIYNSTNAGPVIIDDAGVAADLVRASGALTPSTTADVTARHRRITIASSSTSEPSFFDTRGPYTDVGHYVRGRPGAVLTGFEMGTVVKRIDANNYLEAYIADDGTASTLNLAKVVAGVRTALATPVTLTRLVASTTAFWVRLIQQGNVLTGDYTASNTSPTLTTAGASTITATLTGADISTFGPSIQGRTGWDWVPQAVGTSIFEIGIFPLTRNSINIRRATPLVMTSQVDVAKGISWAGTAADSTISQLTIAECDFTANAQAVSATDIVGITDPAHIAVLSLRNNRYADGTTDGASLTGAFFPPKVITADYTIAPNADTGSVLVLDSGANHTITLPATAPVGTSVGMRQRGLGAALFSAASGATIVSQAGFTKTNGAGSAVSLYVDNNSDGSHAEWTIDGNGA